MLAIGFSQRSHKIFAVGEKGKVLDLIRKERNCMLKLLKSAVKTNLPPVKL